MGHVSFYVTGLNAFALLRKVSSRRAKRPTLWFNDCIAANIKEKNHAKQIAVQSGGERKLKNELMVIIREAKTSYLWDAMSKAWANSKLAAYMCKCVNGVIGRDKSGRTEFPRSVSLDIINEFFQSVAIGIQRHPARDYNIPSSEHVSNCDRLCENPPCTHLVVIRETPVQRF